MGTGLTVRRRARGTALHVGDIARMRRPLVAVAASSRLLDVALGSARACPSPTAASRDLRQTLRERSRLDPYACRGRACGRRWCRGWGAMLSRGGVVPAPRGPSWGPGRIVPASDSRWQPPVNGVADQRRRPPDMTSSEPPSSSQSNKNSIYSIVRPLIWQSPCFIL